MLVKLSMDKTVHDAAAALQAAVEANHFEVMQVHNLKETMEKKGVEFTHECLMFQVCQPQQAKKVLEQNMSVSTALPCRISIYEEGGKAILATLKPTTPLAMFNAPQLEKGGAGSGRYDCQDYDRDGIRLIGCLLDASKDRILLAIAERDCSGFRDEPEKIMSGDYL